MNTLNLILRVVIVLMLLPIASIAYIEELVTGHCFWFDNLVTSIKNILPPLKIRKVS